MRVLVDTCVLAEARHPRGNPSVRAALGSIPENALFLSVVTVGEIVKGITLLPHGRKRQDLELWLAGLSGRFSDRILAVDFETARIWGEIAAREQLQGFQLPASDGLIAATALQHGLHIMTRNTKHFAASGALIVDPWHGV